MDVREIGCFTPSGSGDGSGEGVRRVHAVRASSLAALEDVTGPEAAAFLRASGFAARPGSVCLFPSAQGLAAIIGIAEAGQGDPWAFSSLVTALPEGDWALSCPEDVSVADVTLGFALGSYRYSLATGAEKKALPRLVSPAPDEAMLAVARAVCFGRDLINAPANLLGPSELAESVSRAFEARGAEVRLTRGEDLERDYPLVAHVGRGSDRAPVVLSAVWRGSAAGADAPLVSLAGKGVCFDTGGNDIKPSSSMLRMKKDMGGAATVAALALVIMEHDLPLRLEVRLGCVENSVSGRAMRPLDVVRSRRGLTVEIGNTDAEGRLVLADLLAEASDAGPDLLLDFATLTGAARVALGPDLPVLLANDQGIADALLAAGREAGDPFWQLPLWDGYREWLRSSVADMNNISSKPQAGAITAGLFLERFVASGVRWAHIDSYAWNDATRPGRPEGGEILGLRAVLGALASCLNLSGILKTGK
ncbi:leucyl aminopeptidase family protein [Acetobacter sp. AN02]|uniref:leucyl aminopeptidase family protein n=1 Tax=Acetobacter sp. AN02 TaxID=2894186 RepID=UPI0024343BCA|nr:leucyl aminopeptidase family protein [Acetobacter sp. AN02]MDG6094393.1 leucyl aminopeptidase family protein [Acetobacter sp. AN02]